MLRYKKYGKFVWKKGSIWTYRLQIPSWACSSVILFCSGYSPLHFLCLSHWKEGWLSRCKKERRVVTHKLDSSATGQIKWKAGWACGLNHLVLSVISPDQLNRIVYIAKVLLHIPNAKIPRCQLRNSLNVKLFVTPSLFFFLLQNRPIFFLNNSDYKQKVRISTLVLYQARTLIF